MKLKHSAWSERLCPTIRAGAVAITLLLFAIVASPGMAYAAGGRPAAVDHKLFERSPLGFSWETLDHVRHRMDRAPQLISEIPQLAKRQFHLLGPQGAALRLLLLVTIVLGLLARRRIFRAIDGRLAPLTSGLSGKGALSISSAAQGHRRRGYTAVAVGALSVRGRAHQLLQSSLRRIRYAAVRVG